MILSFVVKVKQKRHPGMQTTWCGVKVHSAPEKQVAPGE